MAAAFSLSHSGRLTEVHRLILLLVNKFFLESAAEAKRRWDSRPRPGSVMAAHRAQLLHRGRVRLCRAGQRRAAHPFLPTAGTPALILSFFFLIYHKTEVQRYLLLAGSFSL